MPDADPALPLSPRGLEILQANPAAYEKLVVLGPTPDTARRLLRGTTPDPLFAGPIASPAHAAAALAGLWLWHDGLHECHEVAQDSGRDGRRAVRSLDLWHAVMHRREGDFGNAKYWYTRVGTHPALDQLAAAAAPLLADPAQAGHAGSLSRGGWNPSAFVDLCERADARPVGDPARQLAVALQRLEWEALFAHDARAAVGG
ncbi:MAG: hypothetical protein JWO31_3345 [Phycisphaerales bacterium]|nr:hypothetical protein [Phycisphaerales bacterium]